MGYLRFYQLQARYKEAAEKIVRTNLGSYLILVQMISRQCICLRVSLLLEFSQESRRCDRYIDVTAWAIAKQVSQTRTSGMICPLSSQGLMGDFRVYQRIRHHGLSVRRV